MVSGASARAGFLGGPGHLRPPAQRLGPFGALTWEGGDSRPRLLRDGWVQERVHGPVGLVHGDSRLVQGVEGCRNLTLTHCVCLRCVWCGVCVGVGWCVCLRCVPAMCVPDVRGSSVVRNASVHWPTVHDFLETYNSLPWGEGSWWEISLDFLLLVEATVILPCQKILYASQC